MLAAHHAETAVFGQEFPFNPNYAGYVSIEWANALRVYTVRKDGVLVGYSVCFVSPSLHRQVLEANEDLLYVVPELRGSLVGVRLMRYVEAELATEGVQIFARRTKAAHPSNFGPMLERMGYAPIETIYARKL